MHLAPLPGTDGGARLRGDACACSRKGYADRDYLARLHR